MFRATLSERNAAHSHGESMSPREIEIRVLTDIDVSANVLWQIAGPGFANVAAWTQSVERSTAEGPPVLPGAPCAGRVCHVNIRGYDTLREEITHYDAAAKELAYRVTQGTPSFVLLAQNHWTIRPVSATECQVEMLCTLRLRPIAGLLLGGIMSRQVRSNLEAVCKELRAHALATASAQQTESV